MHALFEIDLPLTLDVVHLPSANKTIFYLVVNSFTTAILCADHVRESNDEFSVEF